MLKYKRTFEQVFTERSSIAYMAKEIEGYMARTSNFYYSHPFIFNLKSHQYLADCIDNSSTANYLWTSNITANSYEKLFDPTLLVWTEDINSPHSQIAFWTIAKSSGVTNVEIDIDLILKLKKSIFPLAPSKGFYNSPMARILRKKFFIARIVAEYKGKVESHINNYCDDQSNNSTIANLNKILSAIENIGQVTTNW